MEDFLQFLTSTSLIFKSTHTFHNFPDIIKTTGERVLGLATNCVLHYHVKARNDAVVGNLLFKINAQLGGVNHTSSYPVHTIFTEVCDNLVLSMLCKTSLYQYLWIAVAYFCPCKHCHDLGPGGTRVEQFEISYSLALWRLVQTDKTLWANNAGN